jgi:branched-chain amino acid transport system substrate-binding protein
LTLTTLGLCAVVGLGLPVFPAAPVSGQEPVRLGVLTIRSGPIASCGRQMEDGLQFALKERGGAIAGRKVEVFFGDSAGQPTLTRAKTLELVERNRVHVLTGPVAAFEVYAISDYVRQAEIPIIISPAAADDITQRKANPWFVRATMSGSQVTHPLGEYAARKLGYRRIATISDDFAYGHEHTGGFQRTFEENGGKIVQKLWPPITTPDYGPYIAQLKTNVDAIYAGFGPTNGQRFLKQYHEFGLKLPVLGMVTTTEESSLKSMGDEALGVITAGTYSAAIDTPTNQKWVQAMRAEYKEDPGYCTIGGYLGILFLEAAMKSVQGRLEDRPAFMKALRAVQLPDTPQGPLRLDSYGNPIVNVYIRRVERRDGRLMNVVIDTYRDVSQFWTYDPLPSWRRRCTRATTHPPRTSSEAGYRDSNLPWRKTGPSSPMLTETVSPALGTGMMGVDVRVSDSGPPVTPTQPPARICDNRPRERRSSVYSTPRA